ncbi:TraR/DksA family transcriptional regulator [Streptomyces sp. NPDC056061]|uniref:TraR/DksA family transcriptional regulator n=1 Tax=Streptomyces sp. NPDC056061 TaxID=3345700 RepID=UPI0035DE009A
MVAKKSAAKKTASARSTGAAAGSTGPKEGTESGEGAGSATSGGRSGAGPAAAEGTAPAGTSAGRTAAKRATGAKAAAPARRAPARKSAAEKASKKAAPAATEAAESAEQTGVHTVVAKKSKAGARRADEDAPGGGVATTAPGELAVRPGEDPWTREEVDEARAVLTGEFTRLRSELESAGAALAGLMRDSGDGAGDDEADTGTKNITREHEMALAANAREMLDQTERALARLDAGTYGLCEVCGKPIGKARMQAFPRATLCVEDKQKQERRG